MVPAKASAALGSSLRVMYRLLMAVSGHSCQRKSLLPTRLPTAMSLAATKTSFVGALTIS